MNTIECIKTRMSIRKFKPESVPKDVLMEIIDVAKWSPSYRNSQPWECLIISGAKKAALSKMMIELLEKDQKISPDMPEIKSWPPAENAKIERCYAKRAEVMGYKLIDLEALKQAKKANFAFYGAPHAVYLFQDAALTSWSLFDMGLFAQSFMLAAHSKGLGTVPQGFVTDYAQDIKKFLSIPETKRLIVGMSIGYPDMEGPENAYKMDRAETDQFVKFIK